MNEYNKQAGYLSVLNKKNPYIDDITFEPAKSEEALRQQVHYVFIRFAKVADVVAAINTPSPQYRNLKYELSTFPSKYHLTYQGYGDRIINSCNIINDLSIAFNKNGVFYKDILSKGLTLFNENCYNDAVKGQLNIKAYADACIQMSNSLSQFNPSNTKGQSGSGSEKGNF